MSKNSGLSLVLAGVFGIVAVVCFGVYAALPANDGTVGAGPGFISWMTIVETLLAAGGGGSVVASLTKIWAVVKTFIPGTPFLPPVPSPTDPTVPSDFGKDTLEVVLAAIAYAQKKDDASARTRFVIAALAEIRDVLASQGPEIAGPLNALAVAIANNFFKVTPAK